MLGLEVKSSSWVGQDHTHIILGLKVKSSSWVRKDHTHIIQVDTRDVYL